MIFNFKHEGVKIVIEQARQAKRDIILVKDEHLYLMPGCLKGDGIKSHLCYAEGFGPADGYDLFCQIDDVFGGGGDNCFYFDPNNPFFDRVIEQGYELKIEVRPLKNGQIEFSFMNYPNH